MRKRARAAVERRRLEWQNGTNEVAADYMYIGEEAMRPPRGVCQSCGTSIRRYGGCVDSSCKTHLPPWAQ